MNKREMVFDWFLTYGWAIIVILAAIGALACFQSTIRTSPNDECNYTCEELYEDISYSTLPGEATALKIRYDHSCTYAITDEKCLEHGGIKNE